MRLTSLSLVDSGGFPTKTVGYWEEL